MSSESVTPCRHPGALSQSVVDKVADVIETLASDARYLSSKGLTAAEYAQALPAAIQRLRGSNAARTADRRSFLVTLFAAMESRGQISGFEMPKYGEDTVYRLSVPNIGPVAIIQKGCPDGAHSSLRWERPDWAVEAYLWWVCSSITYEPGVHVWKGVNRLRQRFFSDAKGTLDGIVFHNELCGSPNRPCPKLGNAIMVEGHLVPPPCLFVMPERRESSSEWNWNGECSRRFPSVLFGTFGISEADVPTYTGHVGFQQRSTTTTTKILCLFGPGRSTSYRS